MINNIQRPNYEDKAASITAKTQNSGKEDKTSLWTTALGGLAVVAIGAGVSIFSRNRQMAKQLRNVTAELAAARNELVTTRAKLDNANGLLERARELLTNNKPKMGITDTTDNLAKINALLSQILGLKNNIKGLKA